MPEKKPEVVLPSRTDPNKVAAYKAKIEAAKKDAPPVGHVPSPNIPHLGELERAQKEGRSLTPGAKAFGEEQYNEMVKSGQAVPGIGGAYVENQKLAGMQTTEQADHRDETMRQLEGLAEAQRNRPAEQPTEDPDAPAEPLATPPDETVDEVLESVGPDQMSSLMVQIQQRKKDVARRKAIESRCTEMHIEDILVSQDARQVVKVVPGKFTMELRALNGEEDSFVKDRVWDEVSHNSSDLYYQTRVALTTVAIGLTKLNGKDMIDTRDPEAVPDEEKVAKKLKVMLKYPMFVLADIITNFGWFEERCRNLLDYDSVKNG